MEQVIYDFLERNLPKFKDRIHVTLTGEAQDRYALHTENGNLYVEANCFVSFANGLYSYLQKYCHVQKSWCGNWEIEIADLAPIDGVFEHTIVQKHRVYLNYCTLNYTATWWDFDRWEKEIDFMAMNGINMPLCVVGSEAVWYETLLQFGFTKEEALNSVSGPAFWAWHLMTNIDSYLPPQDEKYIEERKVLGQKILKRYIEFGMQPIQQGFSGHVPVLLKEKYPKSKIVKKNGWCGFPKTGQLDPLDPLFQEFGMAYLKNLERLFGNYHYIACDPFHEGTPPQPWPWYLRAVGKSINTLYENFDPQSIWVMQAWTLHKNIVTAVPQDRLMLLDLNSERSYKYRRIRKYPVIAGMLHNFGGKNAMQGKVRVHTKNAYLKLQGKGSNVVGSGMFMEGIEQNPVVYDLQFHMLTESNAIDFDTWLRDYILRRYGAWNEALYSAWQLLLETCYSDTGYEENEVGSTLASRPQFMPVRTGPCCFAKVWYDTKKLEKALELFLSVSDLFAESDGYQYDLCDLTRQVLSNRFHDRQKEWKVAYEKKNIALVEQISKEQLDLLLDLDALLGHRKEMCLSRWINDAHNLATDEAEKQYYDFNARTLITEWGDIRGTTYALYDYSWREWNGLIKEYYYVRWDMFYKEAIAHLKEGTAFYFRTGNDYPQRMAYRSFPFGKKLNEFELSYAKDYKDYPYPENTDVLPDAKRLFDKWQIAK